jgi:hypothetical protein
MKKIINNDGGMPGKVTDLCLIQDTAQLGLALIINNFITESICIVAGLVKSIVSGTITITEGYYFDGTEIHYVPAASFAVTSGYKLYLISHVTTEESRHFHDTTDHDVWTNNDFLAGYAAAIPGGGIDFDSLISLNQQQIDDILALIKLNNHFIGQISIPYQPAFSGATAYKAISIACNAFDDIMILAAFTATNNGKLCTMPPDFRPSGDLERSFYAAGAAGMLKIKANGELWVTGCNINGGANVITCQFQRVFDDPVGYQFPGGGGLAGGGSSDKMVINGVTEDTAFPAAIKASMNALYILIENTTTNTAYLSFGTVLGGVDLGGHVTINPKVGAVNGLTKIPINNIFSLAVDTPVYININSGGDAWNGTVLNVTIKSEAI